jgi:hypothetical protein
MGHVVRGGLLAVAVLLGTSSLSTAGESVAPSVPLPSTGNVTVARLTLKAAAKRASVPKLTLAGRGGLSADAYAVATVSKTRVPSVFGVTVAVVQPSTAPSLGQAATGGQPLTLRLPAGFSLASRAQVAANVLYSNPKPPFGLVTTGPGELLAGTSPAKLPLEQVVKDAQLLALDRSVPLADMALLGLPFVAVQVARPRTTSPEVTIVLSRLSQVNAVEVRFPSGLKVASAAAPAGTEATVTGSAVRVIASSSFFDEGIAYSFKLQLSRAPRAGEFATVRASTHYFENTLPFTERFAL